VPMPAFAIPPMAAPTASAVPFTTPVGDPVASAKTADGGVGTPMAAAVPAEAGAINLTSLNVADAERVLIQHALAAADNNRTRAAELLGISVRTLRNKLNGPGATQDSDTD